MAAGEFVEVEFVAFGEEDIAKVAGGGEDGIAVAGEVDFVCAGFEVETEREFGGGDELSGEPVGLGDGLRTGRGGSVWRGPMEGAGLGDDVAEEFGMAETGVGGGESTEAGTGDDGEVWISGEIVASAGPG